MSLTTDMRNPNLTPDQVASRELLRMLVRSVIFCPVSGELLDVRTAVLVEGSTTDGRDVPAQVIAPGVWASRGEAVIAAATAAGVTTTVTVGAA